MIVTSESSESVPLGSEDFELVTMVRDTVGSRLLRLASKPESFAIQVLSQHKRLQVGKGSLAIRRGLKVGLRQLGTFRPG